MSDIKNSTPVVKVSNLTKKFGSNVAVDHINFEVKRGEFLGVLGPNGAGKTTTMRMLLGVTTPTEGEVSVLDYALPDGASEIRARVGVVPQHDNLDPDFTVVENLITHASYFGIGKKQLESRLDYLLNFASLESKANSLVPTLSGGMQRRLTLSRALLNEPELLILDEPTTGLDPQARHLIWQRLRELRKQGTTISLTTHFLEEAERLCDRVLLIDHGKILEEGSPQELIKKHIDPYVLEIHGETDSLWSEAQERFQHLRMERAGETIYCYCGSETAFLKEIEEWPGINFTNRPANLEDVFLKLTGRELRDE